MLHLTRRNALLTAACAGAAFGLPKPVSFIEAALAQKGPEAGKGFRPFNFGTNQGFVLNDGVWEKPHDPAFIQNVSVEETKAALAAAGIANDVDKVKQYEWDTEVIPGIHPIAAPGQPRATLHSLSGRARSS
jgi:hypothetical protein